MKREYQFANFKPTNVLFQTRHIAHNCKVLVSSRKRPQARGMISLEATAGPATVIYTVTTHVNSTMTGGTKIENYLACPSTNYSFKVQILLPIEPLTKPFSPHRFLLLSITLAPSQTYKRFSASPEVAVAAPEPSCLVEIRKTGE
jgi:hypothetical protein